ncbi:hypothetical protein HY993_03360 [Candidatus Micrarchaeota archaeon]|nr:hypothetical protein [Candidatus Micrarchaeota archaeon]
MKIIFALEKIVEKNLFNEQRATKKEDFPFLAGVRLGTIVRNEIKKHFPNVDAGIRSSPGFQHVLLTDGKISITTTHDHREKKFTVDLGGLKNNDKLKSGLKQIALQYYGKVG